MASVVAEVDEFDEAADFDGSLADRLLTMPLTAHTEERSGIWELGRSAKDWMVGGCACCLTTIHDHHLQADQIATKVLVKRLDSLQGGLSSSESEADEEESVVTGDEHDDEAPSEEGDETVATDGDEGALKEVIVTRSGERELSHGSTAGSSTGAAAKSTDGTTPAKSTAAKRRPPSHHIKRRPPWRLNNPLDAYPPTTLRAIQALEKLKLHKQRGGDFK